MGIIDDLKVTHTRSNVIQYNEYYPFGLQTSASWTRDNNSNNFLYNAANELNKTTGWYDTFFRGYDPSLGRFMQIDPLAQMYTDDTPYHYAGNNPVLFNDPLGDKVSGGNMFARMYDGFHAWQYGRSAEGFASWMDDAGFGGFGGEATGQGYFIGRPVEEIWMVSRYKNEDGSAGDIIDEYFDHYVYEVPQQGGSGNLVISFPGIDNTYYKGSNWDVLPANSLEEALTTIASYKASFGLKNLIIFAHGSNNSLSLRNNTIRSGDFRYDNLYRRDMIKLLNIVSSGGTLMFFGCRVGKLLGQVMQEYASCEINTSVNSNLSLGLAHDSTPFLQAIKLNTAISAVTMFESFNPGITNLRDGSIYQDTVINGNGSFSVIK